MIADVPCLMERERKESQLKVGLINACAFSKAGDSGLTRENRRRSSVSFDKSLFTLHDLLFTAAYCLVDSASC